MIGELDLDEGWVDHRVREEFPELRLLSAPIDAVVGRSSKPLKERLGYLSTRFRGAEAIVLRQRPVPQAYRIFYREVGLDPDATRTPVEEAAMNRLVHGGFRSRDRLSDSLLLAVAETGAPVWAVDEDRLDGPLGIRPATPGERLGPDEYAHDLPAGRLLVADAAGPVCELFGRMSAHHEPSKETTRMRLFSIQVSGVPEVHVEEALWMAAGALTSA